MHALSPKVLLALWVTISMLACGAETASQTDTFDIQAEETLDDTGLDVSDSADNAEDASPETPPWESLVDNPIWTLSITPEDLEALEEDVFADVEVPATLMAEGAFYNLTIKLQGGSSRVYPKKNYRLKFSSKAPFMGDSFGDGGEKKGFARLILRASWKDQSFVREALAFEALRAIGLHAPRVTWINLKLNDEYWGFYTVVEPVDTDFLERRQLRPGGTLYKAVDQAAGFHPEVDIQKGYEKKEGPGKDDTDYADLAALLELIWETPATEEDYLSTLDPIFPVERMMKRLMWASYTQNGDSIRHNYYLYHEPSLWPDEEEQKGVWWILPWDSDICFANHWNVDRDMEPIENDTMLNGPAFLSERFAEIESFRHSFVDTYQDYLASTWSTEAMSQIAEKLFSRHVADVNRDLNRWERTSHAEEEFDEIRLFLEERPKILHPLLLEFRENRDIDEIDP